MPGELKDSIVNGASDGWRGRKETGRMLNERTTDRREALDMCWKISICDMKMNSKRNHHGIRQP